MNLVKEYLNDIGMFEVLGATEEVELANRIKIGRDAKAELESNPDMDPDKRSLLCDLVNDGEYAREDLINHNLKLVVKVAKNYNNSHMELMDLIQEGNLGLINAVDKFDPQYGCRFSTCAVPWIKQAITKAIQEKGKMIYIPAHIFQALSKYRQALEKLGADGHEPTQEELAKELGVTVDKIALLEEQRYDTASLSTPLGDDSEDTLEDLQADSSENPIEYANRIFLEGKVQEALLKLKPKQMQVVKLYLGWGAPNDPVEYFTPHTFDEVGRMLDKPVSRERARQIYNEAISILRLELKDFCK